MGRGMVVLDNPNLGLGSKKSKNGSLAVTRDPLTGALKSRDLTTRYQIKQIATG